MASLEVQADEIEEVYGGSGKAREVTSKLSRRPSMGAFDLGCGSDRWNDWESAKKLGACWTFGRSWPRRQCIEK